MDYLLEIGTEELPAGTTGEIANNFQALFVNKLSEFGITPQPPYKGEQKASKQNSINIQLFSTPRRIALLVSGLPTQTEAKEELVKGPAPTAPAQAIEGFAKKNQIAKEDLEVIEGRFCFKKKIQPIKIQEVLQQSLEHATSSLSGEKWMTWAEGEFNFSRPVRWLVSLLDSEIFPIKLFGLTADRKTRVNRLSEAESQNNVKFVEIDSAQNYVQILRSDKCLVEPLREERKKRILQQIDEIKKREKFNVGVKDELVEEVIDLLEWPTALVSEFEEEFLKLPGFLIATVLSHHQRYFYCYKDSPFQESSFAFISPEERLLNKFIFIAQCKAEAQQTVIKGNERVLRARLKDAEFFVQEDLKIPLIERKKKLANNIFQKELGINQSSMFHKVERLKKGVEGIFNLLDSDVKEEIELEKLRKITELSKCDLASSIVFEFPELQGLAGGFIAKKQLLGLDYTAISDQYKPTSSESNDIPSSLSGLILSIVDKADNIVSMFSIGKIPSGSADPFAIRRQTQGIVEILLDSNLLRNLNLENIFQNAFVALKGSSVGFEEFFDNKLADFARQRLLFVLSKSFEKSVVDAYAQSSCWSINPIDIRFSLNALSINILQSCPNPIAWLQSVRRVGRILKSYNDSTNLREEFFVESVEKNLYEGVKLFYAIYDDLFIRRKTEKSEHFWRSIYSLQPLIDEFFEGVMVEDPNPEIAHNRKALLHSLKQKLDEVFFAPDWDKLVQYMEEKTKS